MQVYQPNSNSFYANNSKLVLKSFTCGLTIKQKVYKQLKPRRIGRLKKVHQLPTTLRRLIRDWAIKGLSTKPPEASPNWQYLNFACEPAISTTPKFQDPFTIFPIEKGWWSF
ncbi:MAG TPA: hypothetical protein DCS93_41705 [Microscillaceae bacterium]|nr:hypothetical protein [Microscillaceae bacterium]